MMVVPSKRRTALVLMVAISGAMSQLFSITLKAKRQNGIKEDPKVMVQFCLTR